MISDTKLEDNSILDIEFSNEKSFSYENQIILNTLKSKVIERTKTLQFLSTFFYKELDDLIFYMPNIINKPKPNYKNYISRSQNWIGHIIKISDSKFTAKLEDKNDPTTYEIAQFDFDDVSKGDIELLKKGALFYWSVGYANQNGQIIKQSLIRFKRSVELTCDEFDSIIDKATELNNTIKWD